MFSQYVYVLNSDTGMSLSDRKLQRNSQFPHLISVCRCVHAADRPMKRIIELPWRSRDKEFLSIWRERSFRIYNAVKEIQKFMGKKRMKIGQSKLVKKKNLASISSARAL